MEIDNYSSPDRNQSSNSINRHLNHRTPGSSTKKKLNHRLLFKSKTPKSSPQWLTDYRDRCLKEWHNRTETRRKNLLDKFRKIDFDDNDDDPNNDKDSIIKNVMNDVWQQMNYESIDDQSVIIDHDKMNEYYEQIKQELNEYCDDDYGLDDDIVDDDDDHLYEEMYNNRNKITCMICYHSYWSFDHVPASTNSTSIISTIIRCSHCKFQMYISSMKIDEEKLFDHIETIVNRHNFGSNNVQNNLIINNQLNCTEKLQFSPVYSSNDDSLCCNIKIECQSCQFQTLLIS